nr:MAG TPA: hypothetical protein [Bacteriophage sp.]
MVCNSNNNANHGFYIFMRTKGLFHKFTGGIII